MRGRGVMIIGLLAPFALAAGPAAATAGNQGGVSLARAVRIALSRVSAESYDQLGFAYMLSETSPVPVFRWRWGGGPVAGMVPAREHATVGLKEGRVTWWRDDLTPLPCVEAPECGEVAGGQVPVELVVLPSGAFYAYGDQAEHGCFGRLGGSTPLRPGDRTWTLFGEFAPPSNHGTTMLLKSLFPWGLTGGRASESTTLSIRSHLPIREQTTIVPTSGAPFSFTSTFGFPVRPRVPQVTLCKAAE